MTVANFLTSVRDVIGDQKKTKYADSTLLDLYNDGIKDIVKETHIFRDETFILVENGITKYTLPSNVYFLTRVTQNNDPIVFYTYKEMDKIKYRWEGEEGKDIIKAVVYDSQDLGHITIYPELNGIGGSYFKLPDGTSVNIDAGTEGAITYVAATSTDYTPVITREDATYGTLVGIAYDWFPVKVQYVRRPIHIELEDIATAEVELSDMYRATLKYYVAGTILFHDDRVENVQKGTTLLGKYTSDLKQMREDSSTNFTRANRTTSYSTPFS